MHTGHTAPGSPPSRIVNVHEVAGVPHVFWQTAAGNAPSGPAAASGSERGRDSLASKSHVQFVAAIVGLHAELPVAAATKTRDATRLGAVPGPERCLRLSLACRGDTDGT